MAFHTLEKNYKPAVGIGNKNFNEILMFRLDDFQQISNEFIADLNFCSVGPLIDLKVLSVFRLFSNH
ncbi:hypothetical protein CA265_05420 [Sphingobacteriaceae bacterium GW460-11-11-14-LB5]|nr:hypothetical protein CA265_05420 [Sphingobacteriaceae bacterium GW460-11-11-14-LB5]